MPDVIYPLPSGRQGHARVAVLTIIKEEFDAVQQVLDLKHEIDGTSYVSRAAPVDGLFDVVLCQATERSTIPCATLTMDIIDDFRPEVLLLVGIAGGLMDKDKPSLFRRFLSSVGIAVGLTEKGKGRDDVALGDVVIAESVAHTEFMKITDGRHYLRHIPVDHPSIHLRKTLVQALMRSFKLGEAVMVERPDPSTAPKILEGQVVCGDKVMGGVEDNMQAQLLEPFDKAIAVDMECIGMARAVCERRTSVWYNPRYLVIRGISDMVTGETNSDVRAKWKSYAAHAAAAVANEFIGRLLKVPAV
jgi:nucleoside phosphorylase